MTAQRGPKTSASIARERLGVTAVVIARSAQWGDILPSLRRQTRRPNRLIVLDATGAARPLELPEAQGDRLPGEADTTLGPSTVIQVNVGSSLESAVQQALSRITEIAEGGFIWILGDDARPGQLALERLAEVPLTSPATRIVGPKLLLNSDPRRIASYGEQITRSGRLLTKPVQGEPDQGQYDTRTDVLAISTQGMLIDADAFATLGGFDPSINPDAAALDLGWRAQRSGFRVELVPSARVTTDPVAPPERLAERRVGARQVALARSAWWSAPFRALWLVLVSFASAIALLLAKRPRQAWRELGDLRGLSGLFAGHRGSARLKLGRQVRQRDLASLFVSGGTATRLAIGHIQDSVAPETEQSRRGTSAIDLETGPVAEEAESLDGLHPSWVQRMFSHPGVLGALAVLVITAVRWRAQLGGGILSFRSSGVSGGALAPVATDASGLWHSYWDAWHGAGLGDATPSSPLPALLAGVTRVVELLPGLEHGRSPAGVAIAWLLFLAPVLAFVSAYLATRVASTSRWLRASAALVYAVSTVVVTAVGQGRLSVVLGLVFLPLVCAGFALAARRDGTYTATFATALATAALVASVPAYLPLVVLAAVLIVLFGAGARVRGLVLLIAPLALLGPWVGTLWRDPVSLLAAPGAVTGERSPLAWEVLAAQPEHGASTVSVAVAIVIGLVLLAGLARPTQSRRQAVAVAALLTLAVLSLALALIAPRVQIGTIPDATGTLVAAHVWLGIPLALFVLALLGLALTCWEGATFSGRLRRHPRVRTAVGIALVLAGAIGLSLRPVLDGPGHLQPSVDALPAVSVDSAVSPAATRLLDLTPTATVVDYALIGAEPGDLQAGVQQSQVQHLKDGEALDDLVGTFVGGTSPVTGNDFARWGIAYIRVDRGSDALLARVDGTPGLVRLGSTGKATLWKVVDTTGPDNTALPVARATVQDQKGNVLGRIDVGPNHSGTVTTLPASSQSRVVIFAEATRWAEHATVSFAGQTLAPLADRPFPSYAVPPGAGELSVDLATSDPWWRLAQGLALLLVIFMATPFGNRGSRRREPSGS